MIKTFKSLFIWPTSWHHDVLDRKVLICKKWGRSSSGTMSTELINVYSKKKEFKEESYLSDVNYHKYRSAITKFRISSHNLPIEKGRWNGCDKADRKCTRCINHELGDEKHYLFFCNDPDIVKMRSNFIKENNLKGIQRRNAVSCMETMLSCKHGILTSMGKFLQGIIEVLMDK